MYRLHFWSFGAPLYRDFDTREEAEDFGDFLSEESWDSPYGQGMPKLLTLDGIPVAVYSWSGWSTVSTDYPYDPADWFLDEQKRYDDV